MGGDSLDQTEGQIINDGEKLLASGVLRGMDAIQKETLIFRLRWTMW